MQVKIAPRSARNAIVGGGGDTLKIRVTEAPANGRASAVAIAALATMPWRGVSTAHELIAIEGLDPQQLRARLQPRP